MAEAFVVAVVLAAVAAVTGGGLLQWLSALAVLLSFMHAQVADRMTELQAAAVRPDVPCWRWSRRYFLGKELAWCAVFAMSRAWPALAGVALFLLYPFWRRAWRTWGSAIAIVVLAGCAHHRVPDLRPAPPERLEAHLTAFPELPLAHRPVTLTAWLNDPQSEFPCPGVEWVSPFGRSYHAAECHDGEPATRHSGGLRVYTLGTGTYEFRVAFDFNGRVISAARTVEVQ
jgi:hypothetical protein